MNTTRPVYKISNTKPAGASDANSGWVIKFDNHQVYHVKSKKECGIIICVVACLISILIVTVALYFHIHQIPAAENYGKLFIGIVKHTVCTFLII